MQPMGSFILLVSVSIKDTIIIKLNNALSTLIVVDVDCEYSACKSQCVLDLCHFKWY